MSESQFVSKLKQYEPVVIDETVLHIRKSRAGSFLYLGFREFGPIDQSQPVQMNLERTRIEYTAPGNKQRVWVMQDSIWIDITLMQNILKG